MSKFLKNVLHKRSASLLDPKRNKHLHFACIYLVEDMFHRFYLLSYLLILLNYYRPVRSIE